MNKEQATAITAITTKQATAIIAGALDGKYTAGKYIAKVGGKYLGIYVAEQEAIINTLYTKAKCIRWLERNEGEE